MGASRATAPPPHVRATRSAYTYLSAELDKYVTRTSGVLRSESLSEGRSIFCGPPIFHSESHARCHEWPQSSYTDCWCSSIREGVLPALRYPLSKAMQGWIPGFQDWALQLDPFCASRLF